MGVKGPLEEKQKDVSHPKTMPLTASKNASFLIIAGASEESEFELSVTLFLKKGN